MSHYVSLDVSLKTVFICIINEKGKIVKEQEMASTPEGIGGFLIGTGLKTERVGLEICENLSLVNRMIFFSRLNFNKYFIFNEDIDK